MRETVIVGGSRTAFGKFGGMFKSVKAVELGAAAIKGALQKSNVEAQKVDGIIMGMVLQAGAGQIPSRQASRIAGLDWSIPSETINKVCASGMRAITMADQMIRAGDAEIIVAGGMESMSNSPYALPSARWGARMGDSALIDLMTYDGLRCSFDQVSMAQHGDHTAALMGISRSEQDEWALLSHIRAIAAIRQHKFDEEVIGFAADKGIIDQDECPRQDTDAVKLSRLRPLNDNGGTITAGNAPGVNDGAAALVVMSKEEALRGGYKPLARIIGHAAIGTQASNLAEAPALAIHKLLQQTGVALNNIKLFEINEAFAAVVLTCGKMLDWDVNKVNVNGGAIALGHPIGASGARIVISLIHELKRQGGGLGIAAICSGGAQGDAILIQVDG
ncbi:MAG: acetyl-CoA C-acetyltransferase [Candidatus Pristimantibacillus sp.]